MKGDKHNERRFLEMIARNRARILKICRVYAWGMEDQDDLYQEILCQIWKALPTLQSEAYADTWLYRIALNTAVSFARKDKSHRSRIVSGNEETISEAPDTRPTCDPDKNETLSKLLKAISRLNEMEKAVITLFLDDLSYSQIAEVTGMTDNNVGVVLHRAKKKLSLYMKEVPCRTTR